MSAGAAFLFAGLLLIGMALAGTRLKTLPLSTSLVYLAVGCGLGLTVFTEFDPLDHAPLLERVTELAVIISLFTSGLKLRTPLTDGRWRLPVRLATVSMFITVALVAGAAVLALGLPWGAAILLGAILAPTDPVLASDVQVQSAFDRDRLRFGLTGEAGLNDGAAFPFVMLGLGLLGLHPLGAGGIRWLGVDLLWATVVGLAVGWGLGVGTARLVVYLRHRHKEGIGLDDLLALGLIGVSYGAALTLHAYGFLAVFAAGVALRSVEARSSGERPPEEIKALAEEGMKEEVATRPQSAPAFMAQAVLQFTEQLERIFEAALMVLVGVMVVHLEHGSWTHIGFALALLFVLRPISVGAGLWGADASARQRGLMAWFGVRGIGSLYYFFYAASHGLPHALATQIFAAAVVTIASSVVLHGISITPLMDIYRRRGGKAQDTP